VISAKRRLTSGNVDEILTAAGIDTGQAKSDLIAHQPSIDALMARNAAQAEAFGFQGTPSFIVGTFRVPGVPTADQFKAMISDVRAGKGQPQK
jgi:protein-disulfide isomerase